MMGARASVGLRVVLVAWLAAASAGCQSIQKDVSPPPPEAEQTLSEGYTLLHNLLEKNQGVSGILLLKSGPEEFTSLIREIAQASSDAADRVTTLAEASEEISLEGAGLPRIEALVRAETERMTSGALLSASGRALQVRLIVEQLKATSYAWHLASVLRNEDPDPTRRAHLQRIEERFESLHDRLLEMLVTMTSASSR